MLGVDVGGGCVCAWGVCRGGLYGVLGVCVLIASKVITVKLRCTSRYR